jgi:hypothetical protein
MKTPNDGTQPIDHELVENFRTQIHALGAFWIIIGVLNIFLAFLSFRGNDLIIVNWKDFSDTALGVTAFAGLVVVTFGVLACLKKIGAVYAGLVFSYLFLVLQLLQFSIVGTIIVAAVIYQAHRVLGWAKQMQSAGAALTSRPEEHIVRCPDCGRELSPTTRICPRCGNRDLHQLEHE